MLLVGLQQVLRAQKQSSTAEHGAVAQTQHAVRAVLRCPLACVSAMEWRCSLGSNGFLIELMRKSRMRTTWELNSDLNLSQVPLSSHLHLTLHLKSAE